MATSTGGEPARPPALSWASGALVLAGAIAVLAKTFGVVIAPGVRGVASAVTVDRAQLASATLGYVLAALLVALLGTASFELARAHRLPATSRLAVVGLSGLVIALASPAVVDRLPRIAALVLAMITSIVALAAGLVSVRAAVTRALGAVLVLLATTSLLRVAAWQTAAIAGEHANLSLFHAGQALATAAVVVHAGALLLAGAWLGSRSAWRGRVLANLAIVGAFVVTYLAGRQSDEPSVVEAVLRGSLAEAAGLPAPFVLAPVAVFLVPASLLLGAAALVLRGRPPAVLAAVALALVSHGAFDVPLHALAAITAAQWAMLAAADDRAAPARLPRAG